MPAPAAPLALSLGIGGFHVLPIPPPFWPIALAVLLGAWPAWRWFWARLPWLVAVGLLWAQWQTGQTLGAPFPDDLIRVPLVVEGRVASLPVVTGGVRRFAFAVERAERDDGTLLPFQGRVRLSWYGDAPADPRVGERWRLPVRLKPRHGLSNPGSPDSERWLFAQGIQATGTLRRGPAPLRLDAGPGPWWLDRRRQELADHLAAALSGHDALPLVQALTLGEDDGIAPADWEVLNRTGTSHLIAISGMNVGLIAFAAFALARWLWSRSARLTLWLAAPRAGALAGALAALGYAALAGFAIPTQRALIMLAVVLGALFWQRAPRPWHALTLALCGVLLVDPGAVLSAGFWLSFGAVALLLFYLGQRLSDRERASDADPEASPRARWLARRWAGIRAWPRVWVLWGRAQWAVTLGLLPLLVPLFGRVSLIAPLVNLVAVPLFGVLLPLTLLAVLVSLVSGWHRPLQAVADLLALGMDALAWCAELSWAAATLPAPPVWAVAAGLAGAVLLLAPRGLPGRWLGLILLLPLCLVRPPLPAPGEVWFTLLDVGQGLAAVAQTREGVLVYDTGPGFASGFNTGDRVVAPFLRARGIARIDRLIVSHADRDHAGGLAALLTRIPVTRLDSGEPGALTLPADVPVGACRAGDGWTWSGVTFQILHPDPGSPGATGNAASCVLRIAAGGRAILLTGDLDRRGERALAARLGTALHADILVAGHHGSTTATDPRFLDAVAPRLVLFSTGYANAFRHPAPAVRALLAARGIPVRDTALEGALEARLTADGSLDGPWSWRARGARFWTHRPREH